MPTGIRYAHLKNPGRAVNAVGTPIVCKAMKRDL
jgi:hypothetical protein